MKMKAGRSARMLAKDLQVMLYDPSRVKCLLVVAVKLLAESDWMDEMIATVGKSSWGHAEAVAQACSLYCAIVAAAQRAAAAYAVAIEPSQPAAEQRIPTLRPKCHGMEPKSYVEHAVAAQSAASSEKDAFADRD